MVPKYLIITIPGTRLRTWQLVKRLLGRSGSDDWADPSSTFCASVKNALNARTYIKQFGWKRWNSQSRRIEAALDLQRFIKLQKAQNKDSQIYCIGHSHGGTVLWMALRDAECEGLITGAICLGTPFLQFGRNPILEKRGMISLPIVVTLVWLCGAQFYRQISQFIQRPTTLTSLLLLAVLSIGVFVALRLPENFLKWWRNKSKDLLDASVGCTISRKFLLIRALGDEASGLLSGVYFLCWLPTWVANWLNRLQVTVVSSKPRIKNYRQAFIQSFIWCAKLVLLVASALIVARMLRLSEQATHALYVLVIVGAFVINSLDAVFGWVLASLSAAIIWVTFLVRSLLVSVFVGPDLALKALWVDVAAEPSPPGEWRIVQLDPFVAEPGWREGRETSMSHSIPSRPDLPALIAKWMLSPPTP